MTFMSLFAQTKLKRKTQIQTQIEIIKLLNYKITKLQKQWSNNNNDNNKNKKKEELILNANFC